MRFAVILAMGALALSNVCFMGLLLSYRRQIREICRQIQLVREQESNLVLGDFGVFASVRQLTGELSELFEKMKEDRRSARKKENELADVYTNLSHDIRTPLTSLDGYVTLLQETESEEERARYVGIIRERIGCLKEMLEELFTFAKLRNEGWELELASCEFRRILTETLLSYHQELVERGFDVEVELQEGISLFQGNDVATRRVIQNLLKNAMEHGEHRLRIQLRLGEQLELEIGNQMKEGFEPDLDQIFSRFYRADPSRSQNSTGLGLSIAEEFVKRMGGRIEASREADWFSVTVRLPAGQ